MKRVNLKSSIFSFFLLLSFSSFSQKWYASLGYLRHNNFSSDENEIPELENYLFLKGAYQIRKHFIVEGLFSGIPLSTYYVSSSYSNGYGGGSSSRHEFNYYRQARIRYSYYSVRIACGYVGERKLIKEKMNVRLTILPFAQIDLLKSQHIDEFSTRYTHETNNNMQHKYETVEDTTYYSPFPYYGANPKIGFFGLHLGNSYAYKSIFIELEGNVGFSLYPRLSWYSLSSSLKIFNQIGISVGYVFGKRKKGN